MAKIPPQHRRQIAKENRKQLAVRSVLASEVDEQRKNQTFPSDITFTMRGAKSEQIYPFLGAAAQAAGVTKKALSRAIFYQTKCKGRYWAHIYK